MTANDRLSETTVDAPADMEADLLEVKPRPEGFTGKWPTARFLATSGDKWPGKWPAKKKRLAKSALINFVRRTFHHHLHLVALPGEALGAGGSIPNKEIVVAQYYKVRARACRADEGLKGLPGV
jgi:hypothetical protein